MNPPLPPIATDVVRWQASHGRNHLPWQQSRDPYRVWLSEIMLQQTQVSTVLGYYERFLQRFPDVASLAAAPQDDVMALWSGLGYYTRARNLHACAQAVVQLHGGAFPRSAAVLATLPGIGRSTAAAIASFCFGERVAILDANVKRVLTRVLAYGEDLSSSRNEKALWTLAEDLLPTQELASSMPRYTQGLMDLGATVCLPRNPSCLVCPLQPHCRAAQQGAPQAYPVKTRKTRRSTQSWWLLVLRDPQGQLWLQRRPVQGGETGIWAGLFSPPVFASAPALEAGLDTLALRVARREDWPAQLHVLTHRDLFLHPVVVELADGRLPLDSAELGAGQWQSAADWLQQGLPAPVRKLV
ncbi:A/G-specific adenine glycosylase, partial [Comamonas aquatica]|uniref:A/G-specific adenine glycosylase n=1 Tax=Comamonas aquatica TaxID=225991 RepID=UPI0034D4DE75